MDPRFPGSLDFRKNPKNLFDSAHANTASSLQRVLGGVTI